MPETRETRHRPRLSFYLQITGGGTGGGIRYGKQAAGDTEDHTGEAQRHSRKKFEPREKEITVIILLGRYFVYKVRNTSITDD